MTLGLTQSFPILVIYFALYSFYGWVCETIYCSVLEKRYVQRGFLRGPYCPIYGFGALIVLWVSYPLAHNPALVFLVTMITASVLEYATGGFFEHFFQLRLWDYSNQKFNIKGRVCLLNALLFGILGLLAVYLVHPATMKLVNALSPQMQRFFGSFLTVLFLVDFLQSAAVISELNERLQEARECMHELKKYQDEYSWFDRNDFNASIKRLRSIYEQSANAPALQFLDRVEAVTGLKNRSDRFIKNYPTLKPVRFAEELKTIRDSAEERTEAVASDVRQRLQRVKIAVSATFTRVYKSAERLTFGELAWTFIAGGVVGYFIRSILCSFAGGKLTSAQSLLYGPFATLYAVGAVFMLLLIEPLAKENDRRLFIGSALLGGILEYAGNGLGGEIFGMMFWEYNAQPGILGDGLSLLSILAWGVFGVVVMRYAAPWLRGLIGGRFARRSRFFACLLLILLLCNTLLSSVAFLRWEERQRGVAPNGAFQTYIDARYPDETMAEIFPDVRFRD